MSQDPNANNRPASEQLYGAPPSPDPHNPPDPYGVPPTQPAQSNNFPDPYGTQPAPSQPYTYHAPNAYGVPPAPASDPYGGAPPPPPYNEYNAYNNANNYSNYNAYGTPSGVSVMAGYQEPTRPLPLGDALRQLPDQYRHILTAPSASTFVMEMGKAAWDITWVQLVLYAIISALLAWLGSLITAFPNGMITDLRLSAIASRTVLLSIILGFWLFFVPLSFFINQGITYLVARAFNGSGTFLRQSYTALLIQVPLGIISSLLGLVPFLGGLAGFAAFIYGIILSVYSLMAVHRLSGGKATAVVLLPPILLVILVCMLVFVLALAVRH